MVYDKTNICIQFLLTIFIVWLFAPFIEYWIFAISLIWLMVFFGSFTVEDSLIKLVIFFRYHLENY